MICNWPLEELPCCPSSLMFFSEKYGETEIDMRRHEREGLAWEKNGGNERVDSERDYKVTQGVNKREDEEMES
ncbi:hypothetical protein JOQ06_028894 [Pogonophryne albipinna]|uniref:Uncharacterized protein n=1 Tax=Pogonophryne albipinna TaxID=1090488 RepID=A0AAD6BAS4_9TELE|nr:hypothetical protein JOQ06_028894 [Pogonophryne albipinna]